MRIWKLAYFHFLLVLMCLVVLVYLVTFGYQVGNVGGREFSESLAPDVQKLLVRAHCSRSSPRLQGKEIKFYQLIVH